MINLLLTASDPTVAFSIGDLDVKWYGIILVSAMLVGLFYALSEARRTNLSSDDVVELFLWLVPLAVVFARLLYCVVRPDYYFSSWERFLKVFDLRTGGITIIGAIIGGLIGMICFAHRKRKVASFGQIIDLVIPALLIGQIIGRWGNFVNQEAFGIAITDPRFQTAPFAVWIDRPELASVSDGIILDPTQHWYAATCFYEMAWNLIGLIAAYAIWRKNKKYPGILAFLYIFWYGIGRGWLEFIRLDAVPVTQIACFVVAPISLIAGILYIFGKRTRDHFIYVNDAINNNLLYITELSEFDVKNYKYACKVLSDVGNPLKFLYKTKEFKNINIDEQMYLRKKLKSEETNFDYSHIAEV